MKNWQAETWTELLCCFSHLLFWQLSQHTCVSLQLALDSARFEFTLKMRLNRIWPKDPTYAIFLKSWVFKDVKYDIPMCQYHSTRPQPIQLVPTMQKKALYVIISVQNSWKLGSQKLLHQGHFWWRSKFFSFSLPSGPRGMFEPNSDTSNTHKHPKTPTKHPQTPTKSGATTLSWKSGWKPSTRREFWHLRIIFIIFRFRDMAV